MLSDQRSPYVGRFARGWRRLPGRIPGQPQTRTRARSSIGTAPLGDANPPVRPGAPAGPGPGDRRGPRGGQHEHPIGAARPDGTRAIGRRGARREHVIHQEHPGPGRPPYRDERTSHGRPTLGPGSAGLRPRGHHSPGQPCHRQAEHGRHGDGQGPGLVVAPLPQPATGQRHPRDHVGGRRPCGHHGRGQRGGHPAPPGELEPVDGSASRAVVEERRSASVDRRGWARRTSVHDGIGRPPAPVAARRLQRDEPFPARFAERPRALAAPRTPGWEDDVDGPSDHPGTLPGTTDIRGGLTLGFTTVPSQSSLTSTGAAPLTSMVRTVWLFSSG